jgi:putative Holliday junction resolvase
VAEEKIPPRTLGLDVGARRIGIAITDRLGLTVQGRPTRTRRSLEADVGYLKGLVEDEDVRRVVVGLPLHMDGRASPQSALVEAFAAALRREILVPVVFQDERLTSFAAEQELEDVGFDWRGRRRHVDRVAATLILEDYLRDCS